MFDFDFGEDDVYSCLNCGRELREEQINESFCSDKCKVTFLDWEQDEE